MAKCPVCNTRKGKRKCGIVNHEFVCSLCCANTRNEGVCLDCVFYQAPQHDYNAVPAFSTIAMTNNHALQNYQQAITAAYDATNPQDALAIIELLINKYYFKETEIKTTHSLWQAGFESADKIIQKLLPEMDEETLINLLGAMRSLVKARITLE